MITVSVVIPFYNKRPYLEACLECLDHQSWQEQELIFVDDGSTDEGGAFLEELLADRPYARVIRKPHAGMADARRTGLAAAHGKYVYFLNAENFLLESAIKNAVWMAENNELQVVAFCSLDVSQDTPSIRELYELEVDQRKGGPFQRRSLKANRIYSGLEFVKASLASRDGLYSPVWLNLYRRDYLVEKQVTFDPEENEDYPFVMDALLAAERAGYTDQILHCRRLLPKSVNTGTEGERRILAAFAAADHSERVSKEFSDRVDYRTLFRRWELANAWLVYKELRSCSRRLRVKYKYRAMGYVALRPDMLSPRLLLYMAFL